MSLTPTRETQLCISLAGRPGHYGVRFHNYLYRALGLDFFYKATTTQDLPAAIAGIRALGIRGAGISMPYKEACVGLVDRVDPSAAAIGSVNTLVNYGGWLTAYNTDYIAVRQLVDRHQVPRELPFVLRGSGGMAKAVACALRDAGFANGRILARNEAAGRALAETCGYRWIAQMDAEPAAMLVNVTPVGMAGSPEADLLAFEEEAVAAAQWIFDVVALPERTPLICLAQTLGKSVISGADVAAIQALEQFVLYTGVRPEPALLAEAAAYARAAGGK